jgi:hypothetical protein
MSIVAERTTTALDAENAETGEKNLNFGKNILILG